LQFDTVAESATLPTSPVVNEIAIAKETVDLEEEQVPVAVNILRVLPPEKALPPLAPPLAPLPSPSVPTEIARTVRSDALSSFHGWLPKAAQKRKRDMQGPPKIPSKKRRIAEEAPNCKEEPKEDSPKDANEQVVAPEEANKDQVEDDDEANKDQVEDDDETASDNAPPEASGKANDHKGDEDSEKEPEEGPEVNNEGKDAKEPPKQVQEKVVQDEEPYVPSEEEPFHPDPNCSDGDSDEGENRVESRNKLRSRLEAMKSVMDPADMMTASFQGDIPETLSPKEYDLPLKSENTKPDMTIQEKEEMQKEIYGLHKHQCVWILEQAGIDFDGGAKKAQLQHQVYVNAVDGLVDLKTITLGRKRKSKQSRKRKKRKKDKQQEQEEVTRDYKKEFQQQLRVAFFVTPRRDSF